MFFFIVVVVGITAIFNTPIELTPHAQYPKLSINVNWFGTSPEVVESFVTAPVEAEIASVKGIKNISSRSTTGSSFIEIEFHPNTNMNFARIEINEKLFSLKDELPYGVSAPKVSDYIPEDLKDLQGFITYTVSADINASEIRRKVFDSFYYPLLTIDGISEVSIRGGTNREILIIVDYEKALLFGLTYDEIENAVNNSEIILSAGQLRYDKYFFHLLVDEKVQDIEKIENAVIKVVDNTSAIRVKDIAKVVDSYAQPSNYFRINGKETVSIIISKEPGANSIKTAEAVNSKIDELTSALPPNFIINKEVDKSEHISNELNELLQSAVFSVAILVLLLLFLFRSIKYSLIILSSLIYSLLFAFILFYLFNLSLNILTISAFILGLGLMIDNSIVVVDYIDKYYQNKGIKELVVHLKNIFSPLFASTLTTIAVFIPILFFTGELRLYFEQFALGIVLTLFASLISSFTFIPVLYIKVIKRHKSTTNSIADSFSKFYTFIMTFLFRFKKAALVFLILLIGLPVWLIPNRIEGNSFLVNTYNSFFDSEVYTEVEPLIHTFFGGALNLFFNKISRGEIWQYGDQTYIIVQLKLPHGNDIKRLNQLVKDFEREILAYKNNISLLTANIYDEENAVLKVEFDEKQNSSSFPYKMKNYLTSYATRIGGLRVGVFGYGPGFSSGGAPISTMAVVARGYNYEITRNIAERFRSDLVRNPRIDNVDINKARNYWADNIYEIVGEIKRDKLKFYDITVTKLFSIISGSTGGNLAYNKFSIDNDEVIFQIKYDNYNNIQLDQLSNKIILTDSGREIKVGDFVEFKRSEVIPAIHRENQQYIRFITFDYKGPFKYGKEYVQKTIDDQLLPEGYSIAMREYYFSFNEQDEANMAGILLMAAVLIFMLTASLFESYKKPFLILLAIPFSAVGAVYLFYFTELNFDRGAYAGLLLLIGLSINNSILLIDHISKNLFEYNFKRIVQLSFDRIRPIFTTSITTACALIPLALNSEESFWSSLSLSIIGGLSFSSIIIVLILPLIYTLISKDKFRLQKNQ